MTKIVRWVPRESVDKAIEARLMSHLERSAMWVFDLDDRYRPGDGVVKGRVLLVYEIREAGTTSIIGGYKTIDFESDEFKGEAAHIDRIITKNNEPGSYGLGRERQRRTSYHVTRVRLATRKEVARALRVSERDDNQLEKHKPDAGWPKA